MAKTDYEQVEARLIEGLKKMFVQRILEMADSAITTGETRKPVQRGPDGEEIRATSLEESHKNILQALRRDLKKLHDKETRFEEKLGISHQEVARLVDNPADLTPDDWAKLKALKDSLESHRQDLAEPIEEGANEKLIEDERLKHINKRFNVREGWLPLH